MVHLLKFNAPGDEVLILNADRIVQIECWKLGNEIWPDRSVVYLTTDSAELKTRLVEGSPESIAEYVRKETA